MSFNPSPFMSKLSRAWSWLNCTLLSCSPSFSDRMRWRVNVMLSPSLLFSCQAVTVGAQRRDDIGIAIAVDVVGEHLRAAAAEIGGVKSPVSVAAQARGLLPPSLHFEQVDLAVTVDVAKAESVRKPLETRIR